jgi:hypothetical protein
MIWCDMIYFILDEFMNRLQRCGAEGLRANRAIDIIYMIWYMIRYDIVYYMMIYDTIFYDDIFNFRRIYEPSTALWAERSYSEPGNRYMIRYDMMWYDMIYDIFNPNWADTRWQPYSSHLHTNNTHNTDNGTYLKLVRASLNKNSHQ